jgi:NAD(P)H dehydrogenase (quinone)
MEPMEMCNILIVYATDYQNTKKASEAFAAGVNSVSGCKATLKQAEEATLADLQSADAMAIGTPVHMGSMDWRIKKFIDTVCLKAWMNELMAGKTGAVFATNSGYGSTGGGAEITMISLINSLVELGMLVVPLPKSTKGYASGGLQWGACARTMNDELMPIGIKEDCLELIRQHGIHTAKAALLLKGNNIFA